MDLRPISTHTPLAGRNIIETFHDRSVEFQLIHSLRSVTDFFKKIYSYLYISTHTPLARRNVAIRMPPTRDRRVSTHAPLTRCKGARGSSTRYACISTHKPLAGLKVQQFCRLLERRNFNSYTPCGV